MAYELIFTKDNRVVVYNTTSNRILPMIYSSIVEFMLYTVFNDNELIVEQSIYEVIQHEDERESLDEESRRKFEDKICSEYDCKEIPKSTILQILDEYKQLEEYDEKFQEWLFKQRLNDKSFLDFSKIAKSVLGISE